jgi:hypothetical protein
VSTPFRRKASLRQCSCRQTVLQGLDSHVAALLATVDVYPLSDLGEVEALRAGRRTYVLQWKELDKRDRWNTPGRPASTSTVLVEHVCGEEVPPSWRRPINPPEKKGKAHVDF